MIKILGINKTKHYTNHMPNSSTPRKDGTVQLPFHTEGINPKMTQQIWFGIYVELSLFNPARSHYYHLLSSIIHYQIFRLRTQRIKSKSGKVEFGTPSHCGDPLVMLVYVTPSNQLVISSPQNLVTYSRPTQT